MKRILFICLGNICRSPMAQTIMQHIVDEAGLSADFEIDSAGLIDYHEGEEADSRMQTHARRHGYRITHLSRPIRTDDFCHFDLIIGMDDSNIRSLKRLSPDPTFYHKIRLITDYCQTQSAVYVPDPYYGGEHAFEYAIELLEDACQGLMQFLTLNA